MSGASGGGTWRNMASVAGPAPVASVPVRAGTVRAGWSDGDPSGLWTVTAPEDFAPGVALRDT
ncbi:hypothetical protein Ssi03_60050 [Sphaerisporangium siamense]|nr:hypothetical protein Ssi03_60050 [Sphaerisporangium siamense]